MRALGGLPCTTHVFPLEKELILILYHESINKVMDTIQKMEEVGIIDDYLLYVPLTSAFQADLFLSWMYWAWTVLNAFWGYVQRFKRPAFKSSIHICHLVSILDDFRKKTLCGKYDHILKNICAVLAVDGQCLCGTDCTYFSICYSQTSKYCRLVLWLTHFQRQK